MSEMNEHVTPIRAEMLAAKIEKLQNYELPNQITDEFVDEPRFIDALWFLQYVSWPENYPGGLTRFAADFVESCRDKVGTVHMANPPKGALYGLTQAKGIWGDLPSDEIDQLVGGNRSVFWEAFWRDDDDWSENTFQSEMAKMEIEHIGRKGVKELFLKAMSPDRVRQICLEAARRDLAQYLKRLCEDWNISFLARSNYYQQPYLVRLKGAPWYFADVGNALLAFMDARAEKLRARLAKTEISMLICSWLKTAISTREPVMISGSARFGKTEELQLFCEMYPWRARMVHTGSTGSLSALMWEIGKGLRMELGAQKSRRDLGERIDYVLRFSNLMLCFDESQFLFPPTFTRNTAPACLNWVRRAVIDKHLPVAFVATPQTFYETKKRFLKATGFVFEQFDGRMLKTVHLPEELSEPDLLAIARIHFPDLNDKYLHFVVHKIRATERNYISDIKRIAKLAHHFASEAGRNKPLLCDIKAAIAEVLPVLPVTSQPVVKRSEPTPATSMQSIRSRSAGALQTPHRGLQTLGHNRLTRPSEVPA